MTDAHPTPTLYDFTPGPGVHEVQTALGGLVAQLEAGLQQGQQLPPEQLLGAVVLPLAKLLQMHTDRAVGELAEHVKRIAEHQDRGSTSFGLDEDTAEALLDILRESTEAHKLVLGALEEAKADPESKVCKVLQTLAAPAEEAISNLEDAMQAIEDLVVADEPAPAPAPAAPAVAPRPNAELEIV